MEAPARAPGRNCGGRGPPRGWKLGGSIGVGLPGAAASCPARATAEDSAPPRGGGVAIPGRGAIGRATTGVAACTAGRATDGAAGAGEALATAGGATGTGRSTGRSTGETGFGATGAVTGPAAAWTTTGLGGGGGGGATTARRAVALISAIERVSGWSAAKSWIFFGSSPAGAGAVSAADSTGSASAGASGGASAAGSPPARRCALTLSARSSSSALE